MMNEPIFWACTFMAANILLLEAVLRFSRKRGSQPSKDISPEEGETSSVGGIGLTEVMGWEFEYARVTASEAMRDRHLMLNFHIILIGVAASVLLGYYSKVPTPQPFVGTALLWILCVVGWVYFLILIRLRKAWHDSALTMNRIKDFCVDNCSMPSKDATNAFRWKTATLPPAGKLWNVFFLTALLIAFLDSASFLAGSILIVRPGADSALWALLLFLFVVFFGFHVYLYGAFLRVPSDSGPAQERRKHEKEK